MKILPIACITVALLAGIATSQIASALDEKCENLYLALKEYENAKEAWVNASVDSKSLSRKSDVLPIIKELAQQRATIKEKRAIQALLNLKGSLSVMEVAKDWQIPNYEGIANFRHLRFYMLAADVACSE